MSLLGYVVRRLVIIIIMHGMLGSEAKCFVKRLSDFWLQDGRDLTVLRWDGLGLAFLLQFFGLHCCVCMAVAPSGGA